PRSPRISAAAIATAAIAAEHAKYGAASQLHRRSCTSPRLVRAERDRQVIAVVVTGAVAVRAAGRRDPERVGLAVLQGRVQAVLGVASAGVAAPRVAVDDRAARQLDQDQAQWLERDRKQDVRVDRDR